MNSRAERAVVLAVLADVESATGRSTGGLLFT
jgi:hypothetical protein